MITLYIVHNDNVAVSMHEIIIIGCLDSIYAKKYRSYIQRVHFWQFGNSHHRCREDLLKLANGMRVAHVAELIYIREKSRITNFTEFDRIK
jgi:hypothetical protein